MEWVVSRNLWRVPLLIQVRCKAKYHSKKPRPKIMERRVLEAITAPVYKHQLQPKPSICAIEQKQQLEKEQKSVVKAELFERFLIKEVQKFLNESWMVAPVELNSCIGRRMNEIRSAFMDFSITLVIFPSTVFKKALLETGYANLAAAIGPQSCLLFSKEDKVKELLKILKKIPEVHLLGGALGDRILTRQGMEDYAKLPNLDTLRGQLLTTTKAQMSTSLSMLQHHQRLLVSRLGRIGLTEEESKA